MILITRDARMTPRTTITATTISATTWCSSPGLLASRHHERGRAPDLDDLDLLPRVDHFLVVIAACRPHFAADLDGAHALAVGDALEHHRMLSDERRSAGAQRRPRVAVAHRDRTQQHEEGNARGGERHGRDEAAGPGGGQRRRNRPT